MKNYNNKIPYLNWIVDNRICQIMFKENINVKGNKLFNK